MRRALLSTALITLMLTITLAAAAGQPTPARADGSAATLRNPLAYVGSDGNVYLADLDGRRAIPLTDDSARQRLPVAPFSETTRQYGQFRWTTDGRALLFVDRISGGVFVAASGQRPVQIAATNSARGYPAAWSPDGREIAYVVASSQAQDGATMQVQAVPAAGGAPRFAGSFSEDTPCAPAITTDPAEMRFWGETGINGVPALFVWLDTGFLRHSGCDGALILTAPDGRVRWRVAGLRHVAIAPEGRRAAAIQVDAATGQEFIVVIDLRLGTLTPLQTRVGAQQIAWLPDGQTLMYSTLEPFPADAGNLRSLVGLQLFPGAWPLRYQNYQVRLWALPVAGGVPAQRFVREGLGISAISPVPDGSGVAFTLVTSSVSMVRRINSGASVGEVLAVAPEAQFWYLPAIVGTEAAYIIQGGQLAYGQGLYDAVPAPPGARPLDPATELVVGRSALVMVAPGDGLNLRREPGFAAPVIRELASAEVVEVVGGPQVADGTRWWQVRTYEQRTGWAIERASAAGVATISLRPLASDVAIAFSADRTAIRIGECITLTWRVDRATTAILNGRPIPFAGSEQVCPSASSPFVIFALANDGAWAAGFNVTVTRTTGG